LDKTLEVAGIQGILSRPDAEDGNAERVEAREIANPYVNSRMRMEGSIIPVKVQNYLYIQGVNLSLAYAKSMECARRQIIKWFQTQKQISDIFFTRSRKKILSLLKMAALLHKTPSSSHPVSLRG
jgi:hypothetical protein